MLLSSLENRPAPPDGDGSSSTNALDERRDATSLGPIPPQATAAASPGPLRRLLLSRRFLTIGLLLLVAGLALNKPISDPDFWWHLRTGQWIWEHRQVPTIDPFSFTAAGKPWIAHEWLWETLVWGLWQLAGPAGLILYRGVLLGCIFWVLAAACRRRCGHELAAAGVAFVAMLAFVSCWSERPQLVTYLLIAIFALELHRQLRPDGLPPSSPRRLWLLPLLMLLWVNLHGGFSFGLFLVGFWMLVTLVAPRHSTATSPLGSQDPPARRSLRMPMLLVFLACAAASLLNPNTYQGVLYPLWYLGRPLAIDHVQEWASPNFHEPPFIPFQAFLILSVAVMILSPRRPGLAEALLFLLLLRMSLFSARNIPLLALVSAPYVAESLVALCREWRERASGMPLMRRLTMGRGGSAAAPASEPSPLIRAVLLLLILGLAALFAPWPGRTLIAADDYEQAIDHLDRNPRIGTGNLYLPYGTGGLAIWRLWPTYHVFIDGRADVYGDGIFTDHDTIETATGDWPNLLDRYQVDAILCPRDSALDRALQHQPTWRKDYTDSHAAVYARR